MIDSLWPILHLIGTVVFYGMVIWCVVIYGALAIVTLVDKLR